MQAGPKRLADLLSIDTMLTLNQAFCEHHREHCTEEKSTEGKEHLMALCDAVTEASNALRKDLWRVGNIKTPDPHALCQDHGRPALCKDWVDRGECIANPSTSHCVAKCLQTSPSTANVRQPVLA